MRPRAIIYVRVRTNHAADVQRLVDGQFEACLDEINRLDVVMAEVCCDIGCSANDLQRPGLVDLFRRLESPFRDIDLVVVTSPDRLARRADVAVTIKRRIEKVGAHIHVVGGGPREVAA